MTLGVVIGLVIVLKQPIILGISNMFTLRCTFTSFPLSESYNCNISKTELGNSLTFFSCLIN